MLTPETQQSAFADAIFAGAQFRAAEQLQLSARPGADAVARLGIYRNNTYASLTAALLATFPVTARMVDERYLRYAAARFIDRGLPVEPRLSQFGAGFPHFLAGFEQLREMRFVAETARLEWLVSQALEEPALIAQPLTALSWLEIAGTGDFVDAAVAAPVCIALADPRDLVGASGGRRTGIAAGPPRTGAARRDLAHPWQYPPRRARRRRDPFHSRPRHRPHP